MTMLCDAIETNFGHAMSSGSNVRESVHNALGQLIKQRKVYYTGKGYFLVAPSHENTSPLIKGLGTRINRLRHSLRDRYGNIGKRFVDSKRLKFDYVPLNKGWT